VAQLKRILLLAFVFVCFFLFFVFIGDFSFRPSFALSLLFAFLFYAEFAKPFEAEKPTFHPYYLCITPKWEKLLIDYEIIRGPEGWAECNAILDSRPEKERGAIRSHMYVSVLAESEEDRSPTLIYEHDGKLFRTYFFDYQSVIPFKLPLSMSPQNSHFVDVIFSLQSNAGGFTIMLIVPIAWWEAKHTLPPSQKSSDQSLGTMEIMLGAVSNDEFYRYWSPHDSDRQNARQLQLEQGGWKDTTPTGVHNWVAIERPYISVSHGYL
jgi:hypothetical protein